MVQRKFITYGGGFYSLLPEGEIFEGFVTEKGRKLQSEIDNNESKRIVLTALILAKFNTMLVIVVSLVISIIGLIIVIKDQPSKLNCLNRLNSFTKIGLGILIIMLKIQEFHLKATLLLVYFK